MRSAPVLRKYRGYYEKNYLYTSMSRYICFYVRSIANKYEQIMNKT